ncbi:MAG TPA: DUF192 domain-containing protein [Thauera aminoaromatica]|uniref:DUF192 domain-containing protein n=2 Tax=Thauera aminoaromatica TaxID=164330 RepID=A0A5C7SLT4_THASP|nr:MULTISPECIES: DUF192 domain-containing protein [Thauera]MDA0234084.1 DUF192 domain-containing protein [Pseudomonadota bacterium]OPZ06275.1 MAG: hypothetical protein BWZ09_00511 [Alphaproteobacteria bacterium ADurb.BinA305]MBP6130349.1 DUF192 domain-containing protein [Thauera sp.]MBP7048125.1 DUF192 domain-containing protein [Thauera sp.]MBX3681344.1 DUF192 domain-containing protein [Thauera sp.]
MKKRSSVLRSSIASVLCAAAFSAAAQGGGASLPVAELGAGMYRIEAEVAHTAEARQTGLMHRVAMPLHRGMVFVFPEEGAHCMWMRNTHLPLSVAFIDARGKILNIERMAPRTEVNHCAAAPARFALEMNAGWFEERGIAAGALLRGIDRLPAPR